ncbi:hypothetical protein EMCRGX_G015184, partial [Ephydatia muelleri]
TVAIQNMPPHESPSKLRRLVSHYGSYWEPQRLGDGVNHRTKPLLRITMELTQLAVLVYYDSAADTKVLADASSHGLGVMLLQLHNNSCKPVAFASRSMSETELRYAQIKKEALATTWAWEKFRDYLIGTKFSIETDHKPLVPLLSSKYLDSHPPRILRFRLRLMRYDYTISHAPGKLLYTADTHLRSGLQGSPGGCRAEPMIVSQPPDYPWQKVGSDLFELNGQKYLLLVVDYFSRFLEVTKLSTTTSVAITHVLKTTFLRYGIPEVLITDNGTQHTSSEMKEFSNSPSELLMGRKLRTTLPQTTIHLMPEWPFLKEFKRQNKKFKDKQETQYNRAQRTRPLLPLEDGMDVWVSSGDRKIPGQVVAPSHTPSSYLVDNRGGIDTIL